MPNFMLQNTALITSFLLLISCGFALWQNQRLLQLNDVLLRERRSMQQAIDRLEGRAPNGQEQSLNSEQSP